MINFESKSPNIRWPYHVLTPIYILVYKCFLRILQNVVDISNALATLYALSPLVTSQNGILLKLANKFANKFAPKCMRFNVCISSGCGTAFHYSFCCLDNNMKSNMTK